MFCNLLFVNTKTSKQWNAEKSEKADQSGSNKLNGVVIRRYRIFSPFPRSIKVFILFGSGFAGLGLNAVCHLSLVPFALSRSKR
jgi:hypothetical protein